MGSANKAPPADLTIPETVDGFTAEWLSKVMGFKIKSSGFQVTANIQGGMGYLSSIQRVHCHDEGNNRELDLVVKVLPNGESEFEQWSKQVAISYDLDTSEINFYTKILPDVLSELPELEPYFCKFYTGQIVEDPRNSVIVLEDLKPLGYYSRNFAEQLTEKQIKDSVKFMAEFHYAASAVETRKGIPLGKIYPFLRDRRNEVSALKDIAVDGYSKLDEFFAEQNCSAELRDYFARIKDGQENIFERVSMAAFNPLTLIHGDLWSNNVMITDDDEADGKSSIKAIDWQMVSAGNPVVDLAILILSLLPPSELKKEAVEELVQLYFNTHSKTCKKNDLETLIVRDYQSFSKDFYTIGLSFAFIWFTFAREPFVASLPRLVKIYEFLQNEVDIVSFLLSLA